MVEMKAGYHNAVKGNNASHNDRSFEDEKTDELVYMFVNSKYNHVEEIKLETFLEIEFNAYSQICSERLDEINDNYIKQRKKSKCQSMLDYYKKNPPLETCMQLGNVENGGVSIDIMTDIYKRYREKENAFYKKYDIRVVFLDSAIHGADKNRQVSEATTHVHERKLILYKTKSGTWEPNITKAYEQAGFERPDPSAKSSRFNNVRMTVDEKMRGLWLEACREIVHEKGLDITVPDYEHHEDAHGHSKRRNQKKYIYDKQREEADRKKQLDERENSIKLQRSELEFERSELQADKNTFMQEKAEFEAEKQLFKEDVYKRAKAHFKNKYEKQFQTLQDQLEQQNAIRLDEAVKGIEKQYKSDFVKWQNERNSRMSETALKSVNNSIGTDIQRNL